MVRNSKKLTLAFVYAKVKQIAEVQYDGKLYDNILPIFNQLSTTEKRVYLRGLTGFASVVEEKVNAEQEEIPAREDDILPAISPSVQKSDKKKNWGTILTVFGILAVLFAAAPASFFLTGEAGLLAKAQHFIEMIKTAF